MSKSVVVLSREDVGGETQLVAHIVAAAARQPNANELRDFLKTRLPGYMIPAGYFFLERMPMTAHGKVDRRALAAIRRGLRVAADEFMAPRNSTEEVVASIWADLLEVGEIGVFANFFELGGHSLLAGRALARVASAFGVSFPIRTLFEAGTVEALARQIDEARGIHSNELRPEIVHEEEETVPRRSPSCRSTCLGSSRKCQDCPSSTYPSLIGCRGP